MTETVKPSTNVTLGTGQYPVRFSYANFFVPVAGDDDKIDKKTGKPLAFYGCQVIIDKRDKDSIDKVNKAVAVAAAEKLGDKKIPSIWKTPLRDGDEEFEEKGEAVKGCYFLNCKTKTKPQVVGTAKYTEEDVAAWDDDNDLQTPEYKAKNRPKVGKLIPLAEDEIKSGDYGRISLNFYYFEVESKGIAAGLNNVQKLKDGESLGGTRTSADDDFGDISEGFAD